MLNVHLKPPSAPKQQNGRGHKADALKAHKLSPGVQETLRGWFLISQKALRVLSVTFLLGLAARLDAVCADGAAAIR